MRVIVDETEKEIADLMSKITVVKPTERYLIHIQYYIIIMCLCQSEFE